MVKRMGVRGLLRTTELGRITGSISPAGKGVVGAGVLIQDRDTGGREVEVVVEIISMSASIPAVFFSMVCMTEVLC